MGVVYEAEQDDLGRRVALKVLEAHVTLSPEAVTRFQREAAAAASLHHPSILPVYTVGEMDGTHYFSMELVKGCSLEDLLMVLRGSDGDRECAPDLLARFRADRFREGARILADVADALQHAHEHHILHRDVKPSNVLLDGDGRAVLIDFGLSRDEGLPSMTQTGQLVGSPYYLAPEQIQGLGQLDHRVDVYALGVVLYELLTLRRPFEGRSTQEVLTSISMQEPEAPRRLDREAPPELVAVAQQAMARDPARRYASAGGLAQDLRRYLEGRPVLARGHGPWSRGWLRMRRRMRGMRSALQAAGLTFLVVMGILALQHWWTRTGTLQLVSAQTGVSAELFDDASPRGTPVRRITLPAVEQELPPGSWSLRLRAPGHDWLRLEGAGAIPVTAGQRSTRSVFLPPLRTVLEEEFEGHVQDFRRLPAASPSAPALVVAEEGAVAGMRADGSLAWRETLPARFQTLLLHPDQAGAPDAAARPVVIVGMAEGFIRRFTASGLITGSWQVAGAVRCLAAAGGQVWAGTDTGHVFRLEDDGSLRSLCEFADPVLALVTVEEGTAQPIAAFVATATGLIALDEEGRVIHVDPSAAVGAEPLGLTLSRAGTSPPRAVLIRRTSGLLTWHDGATSRAELPLGEAVTAWATLPLPGGSPALALGTASGRVLLLDREARIAWETNEGAEVRSLGVGDLDGDGEFELGVVHGGQLSILTARGEVRLQLDCPRPAAQVGFADLDGDGTDEMVVSGERTLSAWEPDVHCRSELDAEALARILPVDDPGTAFLVQSGDRRLLRVGRDGGLIGSLEAPGPVRAATVVQHEEESLLLVGCANGVCGLLDLEGRARFLVDLKSPVRLLHAPRRPGPGFVAGAVLEEGRILALDEEGTPSFALEPRGKGTVTWIHAGELHPDPGPELLAVTDQGAWFVVNSAGVPVGQHRLPSAPERLVVWDPDQGDQPRVAFACPGGLLEIRDLVGALRESYQFEVAITALAVTRGEGSAEEAGAGPATCRFWLGLASGEVLALDGEGAVEERRLLPGAPLRLEALSGGGLCAVLRHRLLAFDARGERRWSLPGKGSSGLLAASPRGSRTALLVPCAPARLAFYEWTAR